MLFAYLISSVVQLSGPVVRYATFPMTDHVHAEYVRSVSGECTLAVSFKRRGDEVSLSYDPVTVTSDTGSPVNIITMEGGENVVSSRIPRGFSSAVILPMTGTARGVEPDVATTYIIDPAAERFSYSVNVLVEDALGEVSSESATVYCDASLCSCNTKGFKDKRR